MGVRMRDESKIWLLINQETGLVENAIVRNPEDEFILAGFDVVCVLDCPPGAWIGWTKTEKDWINPDDVIEEA